MLRQFGERVDCSFRQSYTALIRCCCYFIEGKIIATFNVNHLTVISHPPDHRHQLRKPFKLRLLWLPSFFIVCYALCYYRLRNIAAAELSGCRWSAHIALCTQHRSGHIRRLLSLAHKPRAKLWDTDECSSDCSMIRAELCASIGQLKANYVAITTALEIFLLQIPPPNGCLYSLFYGSIWHLRSACPVGRTIGRWHHRELSSLNESFLLSWQFFSEHLQVADCGEEQLDVKSGLTISDISL